MILTILIAFISIIGLLVLHEFGHFIVAKKFGVKVEEFGVGYPPRLFGKKFGETLYSLNLIPFGAFVRMPGEIEKNSDSGSFSAQPVWKRVLIAFSGVLSFWLMSVVLFSIVFNLGTPVSISDEENSNLIEPKVQIVGISPDSPAQIAGIKVGDTIKQFSPAESGIQFPINKVKEVHELTEKDKGQEVIFTIERGKEIFTASLVPRVSPPIGEGALGIALIRTAIKSYPWWKSPLQGIGATFNTTSMIIQGYGQAIKNVIFGKPTGVELIGPVGVVNLLAQASQLGINYFLQFIGIIAIYIALFNILPIPSVDGGKILFLGIEAIRKKPVSEKIEQNITTFFFGLLILLMIFVTIKDITRLF